MADSPFYSPHELARLGCTSVGRHVQVSRLARFYGFHGSVGDHTRIDDFVILKGHVEIGCYVHISAFSMMGFTLGKK